jgi:peroxiredoxin Q/BCP
MKLSAARIMAGMKQTLSIAAAALALCLAAPVSQLLAAEVPAEGTMAPEFKLQSQEGKTVDLKDFRGQWVVLYFYPKDMTQGCTIEAHNFQRDLAQYVAKNAAILGVSADTTDSHQQFCTKESLTFKLLADPDKKVIAEYGSLSPRGPVAARNTFLIDPKGVIRKVYIGVKPDPHSAEVLAALAELQVKSE